MTGIFRQCPETAGDCPDNTGKHNCLDVLSCESSDPECEEQEAGPSGCIKRDYYARAVEPDTPTGLSDSKVHVSAHTPGEKAQAPPVDAHLPDPEAQPLKTGGSIAVTLHRVGSIAVTLHRVGSIAITLHRVGSIAVTLPHVGNHLILLLPDAGRTGPDSLSVLGETRMPSFAKVPALPRPPRKPPWNSWQF